MSLHCSKRYVKFYLKSLKNEFLNYILLGIVFVHPVLRCSFKEIFEAIIPPQAFVYFQIKLECVLLSLRVVTF